MRFVVMVALYWACVFTGLSTNLGSCAAQKDHNEAFDLLWPLQMTCVWWLTLMGILAASLGCCHLVMEGKKKASPDKALSQKQKMVGTESSCCAELKRTWWFERRASLKTPVLNVRIWFAQAATIGCSNGDGLGMSRWQGRSTQARAGKCLSRCWISSSYNRRDGAWACPRKFGDGPSRVWWWNL